MDQARSRRVVVSTLLWFAVLQVVCVLSVRYAGENMWVPRLRLQQAAALTPPPDVIVLGDSRIAMGLDPDRIERCLSQENLGQRFVYNFGEAGMVPSCYPLILRNLWKRGVRPKLVVAGLSVYGLNARLNHHGAFAEQYISLRYLPAVIRSTRDFELSSKLICAVLFPCYRDHVTLRRYFVALFGGSADALTDYYGAIFGKGSGSWVLDSRGRLHVPMTRLDDSASKYSKRKLEGYKPLDEFELGSYPVWAIEELARMCIRSGTQLVFFQTPVASNHFRYYQDGQVEQFQQVVTRISEKYGIPFLDLSRTLPDDCFWDSNHLNDRGIDRLADILCEQVIEQLQAAPGRD